MSCSRMNGTTQIQQSIFPRLLLDTEKATEMPLTETEVRVK